MENKPSNDSLIAYLAAAAPALLQLIAVWSTGLTDILRFDQFVLNPGFINAANFLTVLLSISVMSLASFWDYNKFGLSKPGENVFLQVKIFWRCLKAAFIFVVVGFALFAMIVINKDMVSHNTEIWGFIQWFSYIISMTSVSFILYSYALLKIQERNGRTIQQNFIPRLLDSLRRNGHVKNPDIIIDSIDKNLNEPTAIVRFDTQGPRYEVKTDFSGEMIYISKTDA